MKIVIPGGSGQIGTLLTRNFRAQGHRVVILSRREIPDPNVVSWDGKHLGTWVETIDGSDAVINLAGRSVNCRYTRANRKAILDSRVDSTRAIGLAIAGVARPPKVWLQASTATIYSHRFDASNDEATGTLSDKERDAPPSWKFSSDVAKAWEDATCEADTPSTRTVILRSGMTMSPDRSGVFDTLLRLALKGLGGTMGNGRQFVSWIHEDDFVHAIYWLIEKSNVAGPVNLCSPAPVTNEEFMRSLRAAAGVSFGLPAPTSILKIGAFFLRTEPELLLKSRRVVPTRLRSDGFRFEFVDWEGAAADLYRRWREARAVK